MAFDPISLIGTAASYADEMQQAREQKQAAAEAYRLYQEHIGAVGRREIAAAQTGQVRTAEDYAAAMDRFRRSQHLQNIMKREQLAQRGITTPTAGTIPQSEWGQVRGEQEAAQKGLETWRTRRIADIGTALAGTQEDLASQLAMAHQRKEAGDVSWADIVRQPSTVAGAAYQFGKEVL